MKVLERTHRNRKKYIKTETGSYPKEILIDKLSKPLTASRPLYALKYRSRHF